MQYAPPEAGGYTWYVHPGVFITQSTMDHGTVVAARMVRSAWDAVWEVTKSETAPLGGLLVIHDWRIPRSFERGVPQFWIKQSALIPPGSVRGVYVAVSTNPILRMAVQSALFLWIQATGQTVPIELVYDPALVLRKHNIGRPRGNSLPGLIGAGPAAPAPMPSGPTSGVRVTPTSVSGAAFKRPGPAAK